MKGFTGQIIFRFYLRKIKVHRTFGNQHFILWMRSGKYTEGCQEWKQGYSSEQLKIRTLN